MKQGIAVLDEMPERWARWRLSRNRRGTRTFLWICLTLYPAFGVLDWVLAPRSALDLLWGTRLIVTATTLAMFRIIRSSFFDRHPDAISSSFMMLLSFGISLMTVFMGGLASPYYAGLSLAIVATGLLYVWPPQVVLLTNSSIIASFVIANVVAGTEGHMLTSFSNLAFLVSTAIISGTGQVLLFRTHRETIAN